MKGNKQTNKQTDLLVIQTVLLTRGPNYPLCDPKSGTTTGPTQPPCDPNSVTDRGLQMTL